MRIHCFDVLSHSKMHLPFNESYIQILKKAFPEDEIRFHAVQGHIDNLQKNFENDQQVKFEAVEPYEIPFGFSRHNPIFARMAANGTLRIIEKRIQDEDVRLVAIMGVDAGLYSGILDGWTSISKKPIHLLMHAQLGDAMLWRSRNPYIRSGDFISQLRKKVAENIKIVALELGVKESIVQLAPHLMNNIITLEHPVVPSECAEPAGLHNNIRIGFLGHANRNKGFDVFANIAKECSNPLLEFHAIGIEAKPDGRAIDTSGLVRKPTPGGLMRAEYLKGIAEIDMVCSPLHNRCYDFIASGTVSDAIANLKPIIGLKSKTLVAMQEKYGEIGRLFDSGEEMHCYFNSLDRDAFEQKYSEWCTNLMNIQSFRRPHNLSSHYRDLVNQ